MLMVLGGFAVALSLGQIRSWTAQAAGPYGRRTISRGAETRKKYTKLKLDRRMWLIRSLFLGALTLTSYRALSAQPDEWPFCGNFANEKGYPIGCKSSAFEVCAAQTDECKSLVCGSIDKEFRYCGEACDNDPTAISIETNGLTCYCAEAEEKACINVNPILSTFVDVRTPQPKSSRKKGPFKPENVWGAIVKIPRQKLMPVFCYGAKDTCGPTVIGVCQIGPCPSNMCHFEEKCYYIAEYNGSPEASCDVGKPAAVETAEERQFLFFMLTDTRFLNDETTKFATAGMIEASESEIIWNGWELDMDYSVVNLEDASVQNYDQVLYLQKSGDMLMIWGLDDINSGAMKAVVCKTSTSGNSAENGGETTTTAKDPTTTTTDGSSESTEDNSTPSTPPTEPEECPGKCIQADQYDEVWTCCGQTVCKRPCPLDADGNAFWSCGTSQYKSKWPNYEECNSPWVNNLTSLIEEEKVTSFTLMMDVDQFVKDSSMFGHEMETSLNFSRVSLDLLFKEQELAEDPPATKLHQRKFLLEMAMGVIDKLLALTKPWEQLREYQKIELGWNMNKLAEMFGFAVTKKAKSIGEVYNMTSKLDHTHWEAQFLKHKFGGKSDSIVRFPMNVDPKKSSIIIKDLPAKMKKYPDVSLESVGQHLSMEFAENMFPASINSFRERKKKLNSGMVSLTLYGKSREPVHEFATEGAVVVVFKHARQSKGPAYQKIWHELFPGEEPTAIQGTGRCAYWNESLGVNGEWDTAGCRLVNSSHWYTVCECNHLSSFALLMDVHEYIAKDQIMEILSIVCSSLSVISLILTLFVLHTLKGIQGERNSIGKHLCLCLLIGHLMALTVLDRSYFKLSQEVCVGVAVTLHYVFLAAFMWMAVEGHHLYRLVVRVFDTGRDMSRIYLCVGYGTPILIVAITCIVTGSLQDTGYANDELCWLSSPSYIWAFMGPVLFLTLINLGVLVLAMRVAVTAGTQQKKSFMDRAKTWIKGLFSLSALLGVTWILGFFYIQFDHNFAYAFIALNGLQGVFIFLTRVVFNEQVKTTMRRGAKQRAMMKRFYSLAWKGRNSGSSFHPSSWFFGTSTSSQLDLTSSASTSYWANTTSRRRSSANHSTNDSDVMEIQPSSGQNLYNNLIHVPNIPEKTINTQSWLKRKTSKEEEIEPSSWSNWNSGDVQQIWNNIREPDTLSQIPEEDYDDVYENIEEQKNYHNYKKY
ncbi:adhesion G protein-coupled receptor L2-like isoform X2 [Neocloeon triangulifer]|uniref:adhesion G protein-coupled receptor L2-like isoform X2 n=1 Tax=Neocloeon triangulifer TaxID=2078957 RepID=UPI00286F82C2|nr:adhesion G protein-coupled receptor L2-like isoform X2 [Neocloeon triangulifer]